MKKGQKMSQEQKDKIGMSNKWKQHSEQQNRQQRIILLGVKRGSMLQETKRLQQKK